MNVLSTAPLWRVKFANLISKSNSGLGTAKKTGLVCYITGFNFTPDLDPGMILSKTQLFPKNIKVNLTLNVLHEITPGFIDSGKFNGGALKHKFPYGVGNRSDVDNSVNKQVRQQQAVDRASEIERIASEQLGDISPHNSARFREKWKTRESKLGGKKTPTRSEVKRVLKKSGLYDTYKESGAKY